MMKELDQKTLRHLFENGVISKEKLDELTKPNVSEAYGTISVIDSINRFESFLKNDYADNTVSGYKTNVENFMQYLFDVSDVLKIKGLVPKVSASEVEKYFTHLIANGYSSSSIRRFKHSLLKYFEFLKEEANYSSPDLKDIETPSRVLTEIEALKHDEIFEIAENHTTSLRDKLMILMLYEGGLRRQELIECKKSSLNKSDHTLKVFNSKNKLDRVVVLSDYIYSLITTYIDEWESEVDEINRRRNKRIKEKGGKYIQLHVSDYLFQSPRSEQISYSVIFKAIKDSVFDYFFNKEAKTGASEEIAKEIAQERANLVSTETLRHSRRAYLFSLGKTVDQVQAIMGDENSHVVKRYLKVAQQLYPEKF